ncbi:dipicolinate synthase subunit A [Carboxydocella sporoproducens DSM 16521]|uniref:Dipicolinate synthase subunit A n=2 Tax=Carboxydocella TaxID=178898 RepID=A0A1T4P5D5_9FIRM|nr:MULTISPECIES: dipicolinate synthase subunit DpsA [Carboxydocella]AVX20706.1 dipicolinate synthase subunit A [Carboxydocella thermautotrophica]SJZ86800.1 dipicolinate synthase subunit A [Carboxydocella sporoproducens DSM 16521]
MTPVLNGVTIAVVGGDQRQIILVNALAEMGAILKVIGVPNLKSGPKIIQAASIHEALKDADVLLLPVPGIGDGGRVYAPHLSVPLILTEETLAHLPLRVPILVGVIKKALKQLVARTGHRVIEYMELDDVAIYNSIPSAEGAIQMAMEALPITIHGSNALVIGFGRTGITLARMLKGIGAHTYVAARKQKDLARIYECGYVPVAFAEIDRVLPGMNIIFNTVPALVLDREKLKKVRPDAYILDLASHPGGVDFETAAGLGIKAVLAPGLPGKVAPVTAAQILVEVIPKIIMQELGLTKKGDA